MRGCAAKDSAKGHVWGDEVVGYPDQHRIWVVAHVVVVWLQEIGLEERVLEVTREALDDIAFIKCTEECLR